MSSPSTHPNNPTPIIVMTYRQHLAIITLTDPTNRIATQIKGFPRSSRRSTFPPALSPANPAGRIKRTQGRTGWAPSADRWALRSLTYPGIAAAMAEQWGGVAD
jgi:hypothetical protein